MAGIARNHRTENMSAELKTDSEPMLLRSDDGGVTTLTLNRPQARNALSRAMIGAIQDQLDSIAADTSVLPFKSIITVPGYNGDRPVPILDRGGSIKGNRLDVLYPTHAIAKRWGKQWLEVDVWEYAD